MTLQIWIGLPLGNDPFEVLRARQLKQLLAVMVNVITVQQSITRTWNYGTQSMLAVGQWRVAQVLAIAEEPAASHPFQRVEDDSGRAVPSHGQRFVATAASRLPHEAQGEALLWKVLQAGDNLVCRRLNITM